jgi:acetoin utilization deacetylase AcuC-like enzyme
VASAGFDTCQGDPLGGFALQPEDFEPIGGAIASLGLPVVVVQEGGYVVDLLGKATESSCYQLLPSRSFSCSRTIGPLGPVTFMRSGRLPN